MAITIGTPGDDVLQPGPGDHVALLLNGNDRFIYDPDSGKLYHDADGAGGEAQTQFAQMQSNLGNFGAGNIIVISGNHGNKVWESPYPKDRVLGYVVPPESN